MENENDRKLRKANEKAKKQAKFLSKKKVIFNPATEKKKETKKEIEPVSQTQPGCKKDVGRELPKSYCPLYTEEGWFDWWQSQGYFRPEYNEKRGSETFVIMIPPPNVTGVLHIGHALTLAIEDCVVRWQRMKGKRTLWLPGTDHAGIATQAVVEKRLSREKGLSRHDIGREKFVEEVWRWKEEKGERIVEQLKKVGSSCDFSRLRFTMDEGMSVAVTEAFVRLFESGQVYRAKRLVNWSCELRSAISDIEVEKREVKGKTAVAVPGYNGRQVDFGQMVTFIYLVCNNTNNNAGDDEEKLIVATTRIETMLGDTAVAVHPADERYKHLHGQFVIHPFNGKKLPIVVDDFVDPAFGTGVVKITPAHDANDFIVGQKHNLEMPTIFTDDGLIAPGYGEFSGMKRFDARLAIMEKLRQLGLFVDIVDHDNVLPICSKSKDIIEPMLKDQWFLKCGESALMALEAQKRGDLRLLPEGVHDNVWNHWLKDCHDWCISRQLWWGHRIPAYKVVSIKGAQLDNTDWLAARSQAEALMKAADKYKVSSEDIEVIQDEDVLDTWFSSQLFPFATLGWPNNTEDMANYYPGHLLETGHDILFFWVARMVMIGLRMTDRLPFSTVYLHAMIRDAHGRKMSKSLGNVLDPYDVINGISLQELQKNLESGNLDPRELERARQSQAKDFPDGIPQCGTDALRFSLLAYTTQPRDINLDVLRIKGYRNFCNKIWQAFRYSHMFGLSITTPSLPQDILSSTDKWILSRLAHTVEEINQSFTDYNFSAATTAIHKFWIYEFCDVYIEYSKQFRSSPRHDTVGRVLYECLDVGLRLLHPMMPFITEELYQRLPRRKIDDEASICVSHYPLSNQFETLKLTSEAEDDMTEALDTLKKLRVYRKEAGLLDRQDITLSVTIVNSDFCNNFLNDVILPLSKSKAVVNKGQYNTTVIVANKNLEIYHCTEKKDDLSYDYFFHVKHCQETRDQISGCLSKFHHNYDGDVEIVLVKQWFNWLSQQTLRGKAVIKESLDCLDRQLSRHTYLAQTKTPSAADSWLLNYLEENKVGDVLLSRYSNIMRWFTTVKNL